MIPAVAEPWFSTTRTAPSRPPTRPALSSMTLTPGFAWSDAAAAVAVEPGSIAPLAPTIPRTRANWTATTSGDPLSCWTSKKPSVEDPANQPSATANVTAGRKPVRV